jgi:hypothetical protein
MTLVTGRAPQVPQPTMLSRSVLARVAALVGTALLLASLVLPWRPPTLCLLRGLTGVPCPVCGSTTALVGLGRGDLAAALAASPLVVLGAPVWVLWPRLAPVLRRWRAALGAHSAPAAVVGIALLSQLWQLHRAFG